LLVLTCGPLLLASYPAVKVQHAHCRLYKQSFASGYSHWAELLFLGSPAFIGPAIVPCHITTFWLWFVVRGVQAIDSHSGFKFPFIPTKFIPFYGGAEFHDYHHYVGRQSQCNFAPVFTFCDDIYGTDKGYGYYKASLAKVKDMTIYNDGNVEGSQGRKSRTKNSGDKTVLLQAVKVKPKAGQERRDRAHGGSRGVIRLMIEGCVLSFSVLGVDWGVEEVVVVVFFSQLKPRNASLELAPSVGRTTQVRQR
ncbi:hypothetical protein EJB05_48345, partial [Eragrostis curvula]